MKTVNIKSSGIKCDNPQCDYRQEVLPEELEKWINRPCPKCGQNLLTIKDYMTAMTLMTFVKLVNRLIPDPEGADHKVMRLRAETDGMGNLKFKPAENSESH